VAQRTREQHRFSDLCIKITQPDWRKDLAQSESVRYQVKCRISLVTERTLSFSLAGATSETGGAEAAVQCTRNHFG